MTDEAEEHNKEGFEENDGVEEAKRR